MSDSLSLESPTHYAKEAVNIDPVLGRQRDTR